MSSLMFILLMTLTMHGEYASDHHQGFPAQLAPSVDADFLVPVGSYSCTGNPLYFAPQVAVEEVKYLPRGSFNPVSKRIAAMGLGDETIAIFAIDPSSQTPIALLETVSYSVTNSHYNYYVFDPTFMKLPIDGGDDEWCLVVPIFEREILENGTPNGADIMIIRLESRDSQGDLVTIENALQQSQTSPYFVSEVAYCAESPVSGSYLISMSGYESLNPANLVNLVSKASFDETANAFTEDHVYISQGTYFAHNDNTAGRRPYEHFFFDTTRQLAYLTCHNSGVTIWDYSSSNASNLPVETTIACQQGGWTSSSPGYGNEIGDVHRAAVLETGEGNNSDGRLLFTANLTMGIMVWDITNPYNPYYVFQWDSDTHPYDWNSWRGAGSNTSPHPTLVPAPAAYTFGIDVRGNSGNQRIHLYTANSCDGLRTIDFTGFLCPWTSGGGYEYTVLDDETYPLRIDQVEQWAHDLRTFQDGTDLYVLTTWREPPETGAHYQFNQEVGRISLTLHRDTSIGLTALPGANHDTSSEALEEIEAELSAVSAPNPAVGSQVLSVASNIATVCTLEAFDMAGRKVVSKDVELVPGVNSICWTGLCSDPLPSGNYFVRVTSATGEEVVSRSVIIH